MFTQEQINEIEQRLALKGSKDTQLPEAELPLKGDETVAIIQEGENRNLPIEIFIKYPIEGAFNVSKYLQLINKEETLVKVSLEDAVTSVPTMAKNEGQTIVFIDSNNTWQCYQYQGDTIDDWEDLLKWKNLNDSSPAPIEEGAQIYNISEYIPEGDKYGQPLYAGVYTIGGTTTPVTQYRFVFGYDDTLGEVPIENKEDTLVILDYDTYDELVVRSYYLFVGNDTEGYYYQTTIDDDEEVPEWISRAFGSTNDTILVNINKLKKEIDRTKISKGGLKTIQGKSIEGTGNIEIDTYINQFASSNNPISWNWGGDGNIGTVDIDNVKGVKASYSEEYETGNVYSVLDVTLKARQHYLFSFYLSGEGECDLSLSDLWDNVYVREFFNPVIIDGDEYTEFDDWKSHLKFTSIGYHYISFYADTNGIAQIDFEFDTNNNIIFYKPLFVACSPKSTISWFANDEDIFTTKEQFGIAFKGVAYNPTTKNIEFTCVDNTKKLLDARVFVKDGMLSSVVIENGYLVITFNTDAGKEAISIPLTDIFNPANYYTKTDIDGKLVPATMTTLGLVKLYNTNGTNKSGLLVQQDGSLVVNVPTSMSDSSGVYRDGAGQLKANIKAAATDAEIEAGTSTEKAITPSNLSKVKESFDIPTNTSDLNNDSKFVSEDDIEGEKVQKTETLNIESDDAVLDAESKLVSDDNSDFYVKPASGTTATLETRGGFNNNYYVNINNNLVGEKQELCRIHIPSTGTLHKRLSITNNNPADAKVDVEYTNLNNELVTISQSINNYGYYNWTDIGSSDSPVDVKGGTDIIFYVTLNSYNRYLNVDFSTDILQLVVTESKYVIPTKTSDLTNDIDFTTEAYVEEYAEPKLNFTTTTQTSSINASKNTYYYFTNSLNSLIIYLPNVNNINPGDSCGFSFIASSSFNSFSISAASGTATPVKKMKDFSITAGKPHEIIALYDGNKWLVTVTEFEA